MSKVVSMLLDDERLEKASHWVLMLDEGIESADREALEAWLAEDPKNIAELLDVAQVWDKTDELSRLADLFPREREGTMFWPRQSVIALAASVVIAIAVGMFWNFSGGFDIDHERQVLTTQTAQYFERYETIVGEQLSVSLPDGSVLLLNTDSYLTVAYSESARVLKLHRGEIHVEVAKDKFRPFSVMAGDRILQAVGTSFSVEITQNNKVELIVTEGKVVVGVSPSDVQMSEDIASSIIAPPTLVQSTINTVEAGEELVLGAWEEKAVTVSKEEIEVKLSWREGSLIFRSEPLEQALAEVERYTTVEFVLLDEKLKTTTVSGRFRAGDVDALLTSLELNFNIIHKRDSEGRILLNSR
jgi:transmembrane sensor